MVRTAIGSLALFMAVLWLLTEPAVMAAIGLAW